MAISGNRPTAPGFALEVEFALVRRENCWQICLAFEFLRSRLAGSDWSPLARRADLLAAGGIVAGPARPLVELPAGEGELTLTHNTSRTVTVNTTFDPGTLIKAANWLEEHAARLGHPITADTVVITSARIGPLPLVEGTYRASWSGLDDVAVFTSL